MTRLIFTFNIPYASVSGYDAAAGLGQLRSMEGVKDVTIYRAVEGQPAYMLNVDVDDEKEAPVRAGITAMMRQYSEYVQDVTVRGFRPLT